MNIIHFPKGASFVKLLYLKSATGYTINEHWREKKLS